MKIWNIGTQEGPISVSFKFFQDLDKYEVIDLGDTIFIKDFRGKQKSNMFMFSINNNDWREIQSEIRNYKLNNLLK